MVAVTWRDVSALVVGGTSGLAGTRSFSMQVGPHLFVVRAVPLDPLGYGGSVLNTLPYSRVLAKGGWRWSAPRWLARQQVAWRLGNKDKTALWKVPTNVHNLKIFSFQKYVEAFLKCRKSSKCLKVLCFVKCKSSEWLSNLLCTLASLSDGPNVGSCHWDTLSQQIFMNFFSLSR
jgi:hypothetical protein